LARQHTLPVLLSTDAAKAVRLTPLNQQTGHDGISEADIQNLIHAQPACLPIAEIDQMFIGAVSVCTELNTPAGPIDNFMVTPSGLPILVECKLWRNPEGRREVVGQILDYAKELSRWSSSDPQREVNRRLGRAGNSLLELVREADPPIDEMQFNDALTANLRRGRFLLLIVGGGIREGVEAIAEYLQAHAGLHFTLGLVELPIYTMPDGSRLVVPRILARTKLIQRTVVALPEGYVLQKSEDASATAERGLDHSALADEQQRFWMEFLPYLRLDDPEQPMLRASRQGYITLSLPEPTSWLTVYRDWHGGKVGVYLSSWRNTAGAYAIEAITKDWDNIKDELGGTAELADRDGRPTIRDRLSVGPLTQPDARKRAFTWLAERVNTFVSVLRPRIRSAAAEYQTRAD
jgi:hypothetical protein